MTLDEWRLREGLTYRELSKRIGCPVGMAYAYCLDPEAGEFRLPRPDRMAIIWRFTHGEVPPASFYKLPVLPPPDLSTTTDLGEAA